MKDNCTAVEIKGTGAVRVRAVGGVEDGRRSVGVGVG